MLLVKFVSLCHDLFHDLSIVDRWNMLRERRPLLLLRLRLRSDVLGVMYLLLKKYFRRVDSRNEGTKRLRKGRRAGTEVTIYKNAVS
jgi:hypothetical protein